jgi:undecaprenyl-diphosphatase
MLELASHAGWASAHLLFLKSFIMGLVEGITEFLPISSTGHLIITGQLLDFLRPEQRGVFEIFIQLGAILAVVWEYRARFTHVVAGLATRRQAQSFALNLFIAFLPAAIIGLLAEHAIKHYLFAPVPVASAFVVGGFVILAVEKRGYNVRLDSVDDMTWVDALKVGFCQCFALIPGTSRSGATIIGAMLFGFSRRAATEFSFFLAVPTLTAASLYDLFKHRDLLTARDAGLLAVGFVVAFISAFFAIRSLLRYISNHDFTVFAWYRIAFGIMVLATAWTGIVQWGGGP